MSWIKTIPLRILVSIVFIVIALGLFASAYLCNVSPLPSWVQGMAIILLLTLAGWFFIFSIGVYFVPSEVLLDNKKKRRSK